MHPAQTDAYQADGFGEAGCGDMQAEKPNAQNGREPQPTDGCLSGHLNAPGLAGKDSDPVECAERMELDLIFVCETWVRTASRAPSEEFIVWSPKPREQAGSLTTEDYGVALWARRGIDRAKLKIVRGTPGLSIW